MTTQKASRTGVLAAVRERPLLFVVLAFVFFAAAWLIASELKKPQTIEAKVRTEIVELDSDAGDLASLVVPASHDPEGFRRAFLQGSSTDPEMAGDASLSGTWHDRVEIEMSENAGEFVIRLRSEDPPRAISDLELRIEALVDRLNQNRVRQKVGAAAWIERKRAAWQAEIDAAKAAIVQSPFTSDFTRNGPGSESEKLLRLMIDANADARTAPKAANGESGSRSQEEAVELASDIARMTSMLSELEEGRAVQLRHGTTLKDAEAGLARLRNDGDALIAADGILSRPAAEVVASPSTVGTATPLSTVDWQVLAPSLAILILLLASIGTLTAPYLWPRSETRPNDYLNDPNWPLPPNAHRELST